MSKENKTKDIRLNVGDYEIRTIGEEEPRDVIVGYALKFDKPSEDLGFIEYIERSALDGADMNNVVALLNHNENYVLGRTGKNLSLEVDDIGLRFTVEPTNTSYAKDLMENMRSGLIDKCSFAFSIANDGDEWRKISDYEYERTVKKIDRLYDVSIVTSPAYSDTEAVVSQRSMESKEAFENELMAPELRKREVEVIEMELNI